MSFRANVCIQAAIKEVLTRHFMLIPGIESDPCSSRRLPVLQNRTMYKKGTLSKLEARYTCFLMKHTTTVTLLAYISSDRLVASPRPFSRALPDAFV